MFFLDMRTIVFSHVVSDALCTLVILLLWHQSRRRFGSTVFWMFSFVFHTAAFLLVLLRSSMPDWISIVLSNTLVIAGALLRSGLNPGSAKT